MQSAFFSRLRSAVGRGIQQSYLLQEYGGQDTAEILIKKGKLFFGNPWWFHSASLSSPAELEALLWISSVFAARSETHLINKKRNLSLVGAISRTFSTPSVSSPTYQVCGYHIDQLFHDPIHSKFLNISMAAPCFKAVFGGQILDKFTARHCEISTSSGNGIVSCSNRKFGSSRKASISTRKQEPLDKFNVYGYFGYSIVRKWNSKPCLGSGLSSFHRSSSAFCSADAAQDVSFDNTSVEEVTTPSADSFETSTVKTLKLLSGSSYLPHPDKEETGGEDAHFICSDEQAIGVADGVGGWADLGIDAGKYARELMSNSVAAIQEEPKGFVDPARVLLKAHSSTKSKGSSTACIIALADQGLHAINLGDSGFMVVRDGCTIFRSPVQQHGFNFTYQLENGNNGDLPSSGQVFTVPIAPGDVIIAGTDGLFDNLYNNEVSAVVVHAMRAGLGPQVAAQKIAALARERAQDRNRQTPFSTSAQDAGFRYYGGKLDDITVVVSYITRSSEDNRSPSLGSFCL